MTVWTLVQMNNVRRLYATGRVDRMQIAESDGLALEFMKEELATWLTREAQTFGVEAHPGDVAFHETDEPKMFTVRVDALWAPSTLTVEAIGGPEDGTVLDFEGAQRRAPLMFALRPTFSWAEMTKASDLREPRAARYELAGWFEESRRWAYMFKGVL